MKPLPRAAGRTLLCAFVLLTQPVWAAQPWEEYSKLIKSREHITAEGPQLFGDAVNLYTGELSFAVSDVSIPGNNNLPVALGRKYAVPGEGIPNLPMGDWDIDIPYLGGDLRALLGMERPYPRADGALLVGHKRRICSDHPVKPTYSGRTSGTGTPEQQVAKRTAQPDHQAKTADGYRPATVDKNSSNPDAIAGREQRLIESNGGAQSQGGADVPPA